MTDRLQVRDLSIAFDDTPAVDHVSFDIAQGKIGCLLGPSGCGKTSLLRAIAGFEIPRSGSILLHGEQVSGPGWTRPPECRNVGMVFQDLALFPHLNVTENVAFGIHSLPARKRRGRVAELLALVGLPHMGDRYPHNLSGGQQQRVAIARALAPEPDILLLDEPFSSLDVELREQLPRELRGILRTTGTTTLLVTHDQMEAFAMADEVGVMHEARLRQWDTAYNLYHRPAHPFVADFIGHGVRLPGVVIDGGRVRTEIGDLHGETLRDWPVDQQLDLLVRPDDVVLERDPEGTGEVIERNFRGASFFYTVKLPSGARVLCLSPSHDDFEVGTAVRVRPAFHHLVLFPRDST
ncbi:MAG: ABC transporter ATP-binding protein [Pseudomonadota bacterium]